MNNARRQGLRVLLLTACILSANFVATRSAPDVAVELRQSKHLLTFR